MPFTMGPGYSGKASWRRWDLAGEGELPQVSTELGAVPWGGVPFDLDVHN